MMNRSKLPAPRTTTLVVAILLGLAGTPGRAHADDSGAVVIGGGAADHERALVGAAVEAVARAAGWSLPPRPLSKAEVDTLLACIDPRPWTCVPASLDARGIRRLFVVVAEPKQGEDGAPIVRLSGKLMVAVPPAVVVRQRFCERCADDKLAEASTQLSNQLLQELAIRSGRTVLDVRSTPAEGRVVVDGEPVGLTDGTFSTFPGKHVVIVEKRDFVSETRTVTAEEGKTTKVAVTLRPSEPTNPRAGGGPDRDPRPAPDRPSRLLPGLAIGAGAALLALGGVFIALDQDASRTGEQGARYFDSATSGVGYVIAGAAVAGGGVYWWMRRTHARSTPTVSLTPGGGAVGWIGTF